MDETIAVSGELTKTNKTRRTRGDSEDERQRTSS